MNPWNLSDRQAQAISLLANEANGCNKAVARNMDISIRTLEAHLKAAFKRMGVTNRLQAALTWDRWARSVEQ